MLCACVLLLVIVLETTGPSWGRVVPDLDTDSLRNEGFKHSRGRDIQPHVLFHQSQDTMHNKSSYHTETDCVLRPTNRSRSRFRHVVYYANLNFVYLHINTSTDVNITSTRDVIGPAVWTWTFYGTDGALEFLNWPIEFGIWSLGLLDNYVDDMDVHLERESGYCKNLTVGEIKGNEVISNALVQLPETLLNISEETMERYGPSFFCYKQRLFINPRSLYMLCKHIVCPIEALQYRCCSNFYDQKKQRREIECGDNKFQFQYDSLWWVGPMVIALVIFAYMPLLMMYIAAYVTKTTCSRTNGHQHREKYSELESSSDFVFYDGENRITILNTLFYPVSKLIIQFQSPFTRIVRLLLPWLSISLICVQNYLDNEYIRGFVLDGVMSGVPMGFRSMLAGYHDSTNNFLPYLGGPYVAIGLYIGISCLFIVLPKSLSDHLETGISDNNVEPVSSPLMLSLKRKEVLGSVELQTESGYKKIYNISLAQFYMLLNKEYWCCAIEIQTRRWYPQTNFSARMCLFPLYILFCVIEHVLCILFYGVPIFFFSIVITRSYYKSICRIRNTDILGRFSFPVVGVLFVVLIVCVALFLFMFCTIFLDACLFFTRIFIFTYTGIVVYPKFSYGYLIFALTTIYYLSDCIKDFSSTYTRLLKTTIKVCKRLQRANDTHPNVIKVGLFLGVRETILEHVIERICPRRKQAFSSLLKLGIILGAIGVSLGLLTKTDSFRELHVLVHVTTALFTCAVPRITTLMFGTTDKKLDQRIFEDKVRRVVCEITVKSFPNIQDDSDNVQDNSDYNSE